MAKSSDNYSINEQIKDKEVRVIGENGEQLGVMSSKDALTLAQEADLDLVKIAPTAVPPVCRIINYSKFKYELGRKEKENKKKQKSMETKEIHFSSSIDTNDLNTKLKQTRKMLEKGNRVKVVLQLYGREASRADYYKPLLEKFMENLNDVATSEKGIRVEGRNIVVLLVKK